MTHAEVVNEALYQDRTVQDWHRDSFPRSHSAIDLDLMGACRRCSVPLYLIEATTNPNKATSMLWQLASHAGIPAFVIFHNTSVVTSARMIWPERINYTEPEIRTTLAVIRERHMGAH